MASCAQDVRFASWEIYIPAHLIRVGKIHRDQPSCDGCRIRLPPGMSMQNESQKSPMTFAYEVKTSAITTSAKYMR